MKRMKRLSYFLVFALLMTTLFSGTSVFAGGPSPNIDVTPTLELDGTTVKLKCTFDPKLFGGATVKRYNETMNVTQDIGSAYSDSYITYNDSSVQEGMTYRYQLYKGENYTNWSASITIPKEELPPPPPPSPIPAITDIVAPSVRSVTVDQSYTLMGKANIGGTINYGKYKEDGYDRTCYDTKVELLDGSKVIGSVSPSSGYFGFNNITVPYGEYKTFTVRVSATIDGKVYSGTKTVKARSKQMKKIKGVRVTKISAKRAVVRWSSVDGATSYRIYKGKKKVKEVKSLVTKCTVKGKGAGKAKYKVVPVRKSEGKKYAGKGATAKPKSNVYITANTGAVNSWNVKASFIVKKVSLSGRTYTVTGWGKNYAMYIKLKKFKSIKITVYCDGKIVAKKTIKNKRMNLNPQRSKKMTFKIKGKAGADLRHGFTNVSVRCTCDPVTLNP